MLIHTAILTQYCKDKNKKRMVAYTSSSLTETKQRQSQSEREAVAMVYGCTKFQVHLFGKHFKIMTDQKPLNKYV